MSPCIGCGCLIDRSGFCSKCTENGTEYRFWMESKLKGTCNTEEEINSHLFNTQGHRCEVGDCKCETVYGIPCSCCRDKEEAGRPEGGKAVVE